MKKFLCILFAAVLMLAVLPASAEGEFVLRQSEYMKSLGYGDVVLDHKPERVVCLSSYPFRTLYELNVPFVAVCQTNTFVYPEEIQPLVMPGVISDDFDLEKVVALEPDLVFMPDSSMPSHGATLQALGIPVYAVTMKEPGIETYDFVKMQTEFFIEAFADDEESMKAAEEIRARFTALEARAEEARKRYEGKTFFGATCVSSTDFYTQSQTSTLSTMMKMIGFTNMYDESMGATANLETFADVDSDVFIFTTQLKDEESARALCEEAMAANKEVWNTVPAVERGDILYLPSRYIVTAGLNVIDNINDLIDTMDAFYAEK